MAATMVWVMVWAWRSLGKGSTVYVISTLIILILIVLHLKEQQSGLNAMTMIRINN